MRMPKQKAIILKGHTFSFRFVYCHFLFDVHRSVVPIASEFSTPTHSVVHAIFIHFNSVIILCVASCAQETPSLNYELFSVFFLSCGKTMSTKSSTFHNENFLHYNHSCHIPEKFCPIVVMYTADFQQCTHILTNNKKKERNFDWTQL